MLKGLDVDDAVLDGRRDTRSRKDRTNELADGGDEHGLHHGEGAGGHGGRKRVCDIVGTDIPCIEKCKYHANGKDVVELRKGGHGDGELVSFLLDTSRLSIVRLM